MIMELHLNLRKTMWLPYGDAPTEFYKAGLEAILDKYFKDNYTIEYE